ncbi:hypothetical protein ACFL1A_03355 [Patescibacteria group bacterium]
MKPSKLIEPIIVIFIILAASVANFWHIIWHYFNRLPNTVFVGISHFHEDYFYYLTQVTQGAQGSWMIKNLYTTEAIPASPLWFTNIFIGKIAGVFNLYPWTAYNAGLFAATLISLFLIYITSKKLFPKNAVLRISAFVISITTTCYYTYSKSPDGTLLIQPIQYFYNYTASLNRMGGVFHLIIQNILTLWQFW